MTELNKEILEEIHKLDDIKMRNFLETVLNYELDLIDNHSQDSKKAIGADYKNFISKFAK